MFIPELSSWRWMCLYKIVDLLKSDSIFLAKTYAIINLAQDQMR